MNRYFVAVLFVFGVCFVRPCIAEKIVKVRLPLMDIAKQPLRTYSYEELKERFGQFKCVDFDKSGFNVLVLPFRFKTNSNYRTDNDALAFSFLLSNALDWGNGNYCSRHAYFVFKRSRKPMRYLVKNYHPKIIRWLLNEWNANHAVGGLLIKTDKGYKGTVKIFDRNGKAVWARSYQKPENYFDFLGRVSADVLEHLGEKVTPELLKLLKLKRCSMESIDDLGRAAFAREKSTHEFGIYKKILKRDPGFAEVRYWWACQKYWVDRNLSERTLQYALAFESYPVEEIFRCFEPEKCPNKKLAEKSKKWSEKIEKLLGPDSYIVMYDKICKTMANKVTPQGLIKMTRIGERYPNQYWYLYQLAFKYKYIDDYYYKIGIDLAAINNNYITSVMGKKEAVFGVGLAACNLGYNDIAIQFLQPKIEEYVSDQKYKKIGWEASSLAFAYRDMGYYDESVKYYKLAQAGYEMKGYTKGCKNMVMERAFCVFMSGNIEKTEYLMKKYEKDLKETGMYYLLKAYLRIARGEKLTVEVVKKTFPKKTVYPNLYYHKQLLYAQIEIMNKVKNPKYRDEVRQTLKVNPAYRLWWILEDMYNQLDDKQKEPSFYEVLEWIYGNDTWVNKAVSEFQKRENNMVEPPSVADIREKLKDYPVKQWPEPMFAPSKVDPKKWNLHNDFPTFGIAARIVRLVKEKDYDTALELARMYQSLAYSMPYKNLCTFTKHLEYLIQNEQKNASEK